ncbi:unnamed protein product [Paramecium sonneborni]|uniref:Uncharacterized protein n=1 Tax=Paramecium sonneborni TaxID=65129 RepID=A0A8S1PHV0_9CILI|nr:unnamed protein product [Paramecium sonneborni]
MGQTCKCLHKQTDSSLLTVTMEPFSQLKKSEIRNHEIFQKSSKSTKYNDFYIEPDQFALVISQELCIYQQFLRETLNYANEALRKKIIDISWDIQYYLNTATNIFEYNQKDWQIFIESSERIKIVNCFVLNDQISQQEEVQFLLNESDFDFKKWLKTKKIKIEKQSIHSKCLEQQ